MEREISLLKNKLENTEGYQKYKVENKKMDLLKLKTIVEFIRRIKVDNTSRVTDNMSRTDITDNTTDIMDNTIDRNTTDNIADNISRVIMDRNAMKIKIKNKIELSKKELIKTAEDKNYQIFIKNCLNLSKKEALKYLKNEENKLYLRIKKNRAESLSRAEYLHTKEERGIKIKWEENTAKIKKTPREKKELFLEKTREIKIFGSQIPNKTVLEYAIYRHGEDLKEISEMIGAPLRETIPYYYLSINKELEMTDDLIKSIIKEEWTVLERLLFNKNYRKYGTKFNKYQMLRTSEALL